MSISLTATRTTRITRSTACAAHEGGASWVILCDTNGGALPNEVFEIVGAVHAELPEVRLGIHCHNDAGVAVANSLAAIRAGARQVQGTINGLGERCGNADLITLIPTLVLKLGYETGSRKRSSQADGPVQNAG